MAIGTPVVAAQYDELHALPRELAHRLGCRGLDGVGDVEQAREAVVDGDEQDRLAVGTRGLRQLVELLRVRRGARLSVRLPSATSRPSMRPCTPEGWPRPPALVRSARARQSELGELSHEGSAWNAE